jgi:hypothetical protein
VLLCVYGDEIKLLIINEHTRVAQALIFTDFLFRPVLCTELALFIVIHVAKLDCIL